LGGDIMSFFKPKTKSRMTGLYRLEWWKDRGRFAYFTYEDKERMEKIYKELEKEGCKPKITKKPTWQKAVY